VKRGRDLLLANLAALLLLLLVVLLLGWWQEAAFGLAVLLFLDLFVVLRGRQARFHGQRGGDDSPASGEGAKDD
jgi:hypothetical protein